jgi:hypothetical protein
VEIEHAEQHAESTELGDNVLAFAEFGAAGLPHGEGFLLFVRVGADAERSADMVPPLQAIRGISERRRRVPADDAEQPLSLRQPNLRRDARQ